MKKLGKILSLVMALTLVISTLTVTALADSTDYVFLGDCTGVCNIDVNYMNSNDAEICVQEIIDANPGIGESNFIYDFDDSTQKYVALVFDEDGVDGAEYHCTFSELWLSGSYTSTYFEGSILDPIEKPEGYKFEYVTNIADLSKLSATGGASLTDNEVAALAFGLESGGDTIFITASADGDEEKTFSGYAYGEFFDNDLVVGDIVDTLGWGYPVAVLVDVVPETTTVAETTEAPTTTAAATTTSQAPKTGDSTSAMTYVITLIALVACACVTVFATKKTK